MLSKSAKLQWGLGHKSLKTIYEEALIPLLTYGACLGRGYVKIKRNLRMLQSTETDKH
jgi:hypothetical protein